MYLLRVSPTSLYGPCRLSHVKAQRDRATSTTTGLNNNILRPRKLINSIRSRRLATSSKPMPRACSDFHTHAARTIPRKKNLNLGNTEQIHKRLFLFRGVRIVNITNLPSLGLRNMFEISKIIVSVAQSSKPQNLPIHAI